MFLIIEENKVLAEVYHRLLLNAGYNGCIKSSHNQAMTVDENGKPCIDFVVVGVRKEADISEKGDMIKIMEKFKNCKILLIIDEMTASVEKIIGDYKIEFWLTKPFILSELLKGISLLESGNFRKYPPFP